MALARTPGCGAIRTGGYGYAAVLPIDVRSLGDPGLPARIADLLERFGARPEFVSLEFTETAAVSSLDDVRACATALDRLGCATALDDFGTGFGTLTLLKHVPVRALKIDRQFVSTLATSAADQRIVRTIVQIAREADLITVAEGVEDNAALEVLREYGVRFAQGFHIARPAPLPQ